jgi:rhodanese-related sulfurtransferase
VRTTEEYKAGHLPAAVLLPYDEIGAKCAEADKGRPSAYPISMLLK